MLSLHTYRNEENQIEEARLVINGASLERFKELIQRATNTWTDAHPEIKELADVFTHGKILQDYYGQAGMKREEAE